MCAGPAPTRPIASSNCSRARFGDEKDRPGRFDLLSALQQAARKISDGSFVDLGGKLRMMRTVKSAEEIERIHTASKLTDQSIQALAEGLKAGHARRRDSGAHRARLSKSRRIRRHSFHEQHAHARAGLSGAVAISFQSETARGDALITEISGAYSGYSGQIHRTFSIGEGPTPEWQKMHDAAMEAFEVLSKVIKDGATTTEAEEAAEIIHRRGYSTYDDLVHGVNQYPPIFQTKTRKRHDSREMIFRENMVIVIQPNLMTYDEKMGLQFGETLVVKKNGCECLNSYPREWVVCNG